MKQKDRHDTINVQALKKADWIDFQCEEIETCLKTHKEEANERSNFRLDSLLSESNLGN